MRDIIFAESDIVGVLYLHYSPEVAEFFLICLGYR